MNLHERIKQYIAAKRSQYRVRDLLTGLNNRRKFNKVFIRLILKKRKNTPLSLAFLDLDNFRLVNNNFGMQEGDKYLCILGDMLHKQTKKGFLTCRFGGDEFLIAGSVDEDHMIQVAEEIQTKFLELSKPLYREHEIPVTCTIGVYEYCEGDSAETMLRGADDLMYQGKKDGGNRVYSKSHRSADNDSH